MPLEIRLFVRTSLVCLVLSAIAGTLLYAWPALRGTSAPPWLWPMHTHLATVGWLVNMVFGVALWMFPLPWGAKASDRYRPALAWAAYAAINGGLAMRFAGDILAMRALQVAAGASQTLGILLCIAALWPRIRGLAPPTSASGNRA
ncbi:MAG: hypothetical protein IT452_13205 [Planctomycetia bacterium]|nr:hypothetical protein [Planctomycetia bacterium]